MTRVSPVAVAAELAFVVLLLAASRIWPPPLPGPRGNRRPGSGLLMFLISLSAVAAAVALGRLPAGWVLENFGGLFVGANLAALALALIPWLQSPAPRRGLKGFFLGAEKSPRWLGLDLKMFSYRPSLIGLGIVNLSFALAQRAALGAVAPRMLLYEAFTLTYLAAYFAFENQMRFTWDVQAENFGWMLAWGDLVLVPFFYSLSGWFLLDRTDAPGPAETAGLLVLYGAGFWIFRGANGQKHRFKLDPSARIWGRPARTLDGRILVSGFWGLGRKLNYTGELCLYLSWTLLTGFRSFVPYLLPVWLAALLVHRAARDDRRCRQKYGELWTAYCRRVPFRMFPFLY